MWNYDVIVWLGVFWNTALCVSREIRVLLIISYSYSGWICLVPMRNLPLQTPCWDLWLRNDVMNYRKVNMATPRWFKLKTELFYSTPYKLRYQHKTSVKDELFMVLFGSWTAFYPWFPLRCLTMNTYLNQSTTWLECPPCRHDWHHVNQLLKGFTLRTFAGFSVLGSAKYTFISNS